MTKHMWAVLWIVMLISGLLIGTQAQETTDTPIDFTGTVQSIDADIIIVSGLQVNLSEIPNDVVSSLQVGAAIAVSGSIQDAVVTANTIIIVNLPAPEATAEPEITQEPSPETTVEPEATQEPSPEATEEPTDDNDDIIVIEGPVDSIGIDVITIFGIDIKVDPGDPILTQIEIGQIIRIESVGNLADGVLVAVNINIIVVTVVIVDTGGGTGSGGSGGSGGGNPSPPPQSSRFNKDACKNGGWQGLSRANGSGFKNQGDCIQYANTGK